ncbi:hypothetical protein [Nocardia phage P3.1]|nr:hypothetical protein [Nocardia phage P3.1]
MNVNDLLRDLPRYGHAAARIVVGMENGEQGGALEGALKEFDQTELTQLAATYMNMIDPYKAPEQINPVAAMIARYIIVERNKESKK